MVPPSTKIAFAQEPSLSSLSLSLPILNQSKHLPNIHIIVSPSPFWASLMAQMVKNPPAMQETWVLSLGWEDLLEKEWRPTPVFWPAESMDWTAHGVAELDMTERLSLSLVEIIRLKPSIMTNPRDLGWIFK